MNRIAVPGLALAVMFVLLVRAQKAFSTAEQDSRRGTDHAVLEYSEGGGARSGKRALHSR